MCDPAEAF